MGHITERDVIARLSRGMALRAHLGLNFYPPIPFEAQEIIISNFTGYWREKYPAHVLLRHINFDLKKAGGKIIGIKSLEKFSEFFNEEDLI